MTNQNNDMLCKTSTKYSETPDYIYRGKMMGSDKPAKDHISSMDDCKLGGIAEMKKSQSWVVKGNYDYAAHEGNLEKNKQADVSTNNISPMLDSS